jgi:hypothetical protein
VALLAATKWLCWPLRSIGLLEILFAVALLTTRSDARHSAGGGWHAGDCAKKGSHASQDPGEARREQEKKSQHCTSTSTSS